MVMTRRSQRLHRVQLAADGGWARGAAPWVDCALSTARSHAGDAWGRDRGWQTAAGMAMKAIRSWERPVGEDSTCLYPV